MNAVSVPQPHAAALLAGRGPVEHPAWRTGYRGALLIHAQKPEEGKSTAAGVRAPVGNALIGVVDLVDCVRDDRRGADEVGYRWVLANPRVFTAPAPHNGKVGMFEVSDAAVAEAVATAEPPQKGTKS